MHSITLDEITEYVELNINSFHQDRLIKLQKLKFAEVLRRKNPYLFKAKGILTAQDLVKSLLDNYLSAQEEGLFGNFLEGLAIHICAKVYGGQKTTTVGIDLEFRKENSYHFVSIKSGPNWGNSDQINRMKQNFDKARKAYLEHHPKSTVVCINGCCYGRDEKPMKQGEYLKLCGQSFWEYISGEKNCILI